jgi:hypothetical protein
MPIIDSTLLHLIGQSFLSDPYAPEQATLRWYLDPRLGLPRAPFRLERRASLLTPKGLAGVPVMLEDVAALVPDGHRLVGDQIAVDRLPVPDEELLEVFGPQPVWPGTSSTLELRGGRQPALGAVCWVRLTVHGQAGGMLLVAGQRDDRGQRVTVASASAAGMGPQPVVLTAPRIDRILLWGSLEVVTVETVDVTALDAAPDWGSLNRVPVVTPAHLLQLANPTTDVEAAARRTVNPFTFPGPHAQHPLDEPPTHDPATPNPATQAAVDARYIRPWLLRLEPAVARVLAESAKATPTGQLHQREVLEVQPLTHIGSDDPAAPQSMPPDLAATKPTLDYSLLDFLLLAAAADVQVAKLLGLATVPEEPMVPGQIWDYRLVADWLPDDLRAYPAALRRRLRVLAVRASAPDLPPSRRLEFANELTAVDQELAQALPMVDALLASVGAGQPVSIAAFALGVEIAAWPPYQPPAGLTLTPRGSVRPGGTTGVVEVAWPLRRRHRTGDDRLMPAGAVVGRLGAPPNRYLNPLNPDPALKPIPQVIVPAADAEARAGGGSTRLADRSAPLNKALEYWVAESDPFGRWSTWTRGSTQVDHRAPPNPVPCEALLEASAATPGAYRLSVEFMWEQAAVWDGGRVSGALSQMSFALGVRRELPPTASLRAASSWATLERQPGTGAGPFTVAASTGPLTTSHDGLVVGVQQPVDVVIENRTVRRYTVQLDGLRLAPWPGGKVRCYAAVTTSHATEGASPTAGLPALAEHIPTAGPSNPQMPPDPLPASLPDAENRSTVALTWTVPADGGATAVRYQVLQAGEHDVAAAASARSLQVGDPRRTERDQALAAYESATTPGQRAAALKRLAVFAEDVFTIAHDRLPAPGAAQQITVVCELTGSLRTLTVFCARGATAVGAPSTWPGDAQSFAVVTVPQPVVPSPPVVIRAAQDGGAAQLRVARPGSEAVPVAAYELYRTADPQRAATGDFRRLGLVGVVPVTSSTWQGPAGAQYAVLNDLDVGNDERYFYTVVARAPGVGGAPGTRSRPAAAIGVDIGMPPVWIPLSGVTATGLPAMARRPGGGLDVVVRGSDSRLWAGRAESTTWSVLQRVDGTEVASDPAAWATTDAGPDVVAAMPTGLLAHAAPTVDGWAPWRDVPGSQGLRSPALGGEGGGLILVGVRSDGQHLLSRGGAGAWGPWTRTGVPVAAGAPAVVVASGTVFVAVVVDGACRYIMESGAGWSPWTTLDGIQAVGRPVLLAVPGQGVDILVRDTAGTLLRRRISQVMVTPWEVLERRSPGPMSAILADDGTELIAIDAAGRVLRRRWVSPSIPIA